MKRTAASPELERLNGFVGIWDTEGSLLAGPDEQPHKFKATDTYEWLPGGHFLFHRSEANLPEGKFIAIEIVGHNPNSDSYTMYSFDSEGSSSIMTGGIELDNWTFVGASKLFTGGFRDEGKVFAGLWERRPDEGADWQPWMELILHKIE